MLSLLCFTHSFSSKATLRGHNLRGLSTKNVVLILPNITGQVKKTEIKGKMKNQLLR